MPTLQATASIMARAIRHRSARAAMLLAVCLATGCEDRGWVYSPPPPLDERDIRKDRTATRSGEARSRETTRNLDTVRSVAPVTWSNVKLYEERKRAHETVSRMGAAMAANDLDTYLECIPLEAVERGGGVESLKKRLDLDFRKAKERGFEMGHMIPDKTTFLEGLRYEYALVETTTGVKVHGKSAGYYINWQLGFRKRGESTWRFLDGSGMRESNHDLVPEFPLDYPIPAERANRF